MDAAEAREAGLRAMGELKEKLEENMGKVVELFHEWDTNDDGKCSKTEFGKGLKKMGWEVTKDTVDLLFQYIDKDGEGSIEYNELSKALRTIRTPPRRAKTFLTLECQTELTLADLNEFTNATERVLAAEASVTDWQAKAKQALEELATSRSAAAEAARKAKEAAAREAAAAEAALGVARSEAAEALATARAEATEDAAAQLASARATHEADIRKLKSEMEAATAEARVAANELEAGKLLGGAKRQLMRRQ